MRLSMKLRIATDWRSRVENIWKEKVDPLAIDETEAAVNEKT